MYPLLEIKTVPIEIQMKTTNATLERTRGTVEMEISRSEHGAVDIKSRAAQVKLDTFEPRSSQNPHAVSHSSAAAAPQTGSYQATSAFAQQGQIQINARMFENAGQTAEYGAQGAQAAANEGEALLEDGSMEIRYEMDKLNFDWKIDKGEFKFTPGDIEFTVEQRPSITFRYTGGPLYVPRSSDPNYKPVDVQA